MDSHKGQGVRSVKRPGRQNALSRVRRDSLGCQDSDTSSFFRLPMGDPPSLQTGCWLPNCERRSGESCRRYEALNLGYGERSWSTQPTPNGLLVLLDGQHLSGDGGLFETRDCLLGATARNDHRNMPSIEVIAKRRGIDVLVVEEPPYTRGPPLLWRTAKSFYLMLIRGRDHRHELLQ